MANIASEGGTLTRSSNVVSPLPFFIGGSWAEGSTTEILEVRSPVTGDVASVAPSATNKDVGRAVDAARHGSEMMEKLSVADRANLLHETARLIDSSVDRLASLMTIEQGKPLHSEAIPEVEQSAQFFRQAAEDIKRLHGTTYPSNDANKRIFTFRKPNGLYAIITPWNFPLASPASLVAPALAGGNAIILKPSDRVPQMATKFVELLDQAGWPKGSVSLLYGAAEAGKYLVSHPGINAIAFVGSHMTGEAIVRAAGLKRTLLELSGNGPQIVLDDANIKAAAKSAVLGAYSGSGQCCVATERVLVARSIHDEFVEAVIEESKQVTLGDPFQRSTLMGPVNNEAIASKMDAHVGDAAGKGAKILYGGKRASNFPTDLYYEFTVLDEIGPDTLAFQEETFGPILPVTVFDADSEATQLANASHLGLVASVFTSSLKRAFSFVEAVRAGTVVVNDSTVYWEGHEPFGGASGTRAGWGRIGGTNSIESMTDVRTAVVDISNTKD